MRSSGDTDSVVKVDLPSEEQAALRRLATLVAAGATTADILAAVVEEVARALDVVSVILGRYDAGQTVTIVASLDSTFAAGTSWPLDGPSVGAAVLETGRPARIDDYSELPGSIAAGVRQSEMRSTVGVPVAIEGKTWGVMTVGSDGPGPLPPNTENWLRDFTLLVAIVIANAESRDRLSRLVDEQAALRRVATLVAEGVTTSRLGSAVLEEVAGVVDARAAWLVRYEPGRSMTVLASVNDPTFPPGSRWSLEGSSVSAAIFDTKEAARIDDFFGLEGPIAAQTRESRFVSSLGVPIVVDGVVWGAICVGTSDPEPLPAHTEARLRGFTDLVATSISNAQTHDDLRDLAEEQAALRRVATLVARGERSSEVFEAVAAEVANVFDTDITIVGRFDDDGLVTAIGNWSSSPGGVPVGTRVEIGGHNVLTMVAKTGRPARLDGYDDASGEAAEVATRHGWRSSIAAPIVVDDRLWGVMLVGAQRPERFPAGAEQRLAAFTDLVATALGNAEAHDELLRFGEEQAALGRVATLVAAGASTGRVFTAVVEEVSNLLSLERIELVRYDGDVTGTVIAASGDHPFPTGSKWSLDDPSVMATVARTGRPSRVDDYSSLEGEIARAARSANFQSAIGAPITVEGVLWGVIIAISTDPDPIPERSEARLGQFTELVATAVASTQSREQVAALGDEQAALRRVATLVAEGTESQVVFDAVCAETGPLLGASVINLSHYTTDGFNVTMAGWSQHGMHVPVGTRFPMAPDTIGGKISETQAPVRTDSWEGASSELAKFVRDRGIRSSLGAPIVVDGQLWGALVAATDGDEALPHGTEFRLARFTELIATAISNATTRSELVASRARIVTAGDEARRRIERNLHDGTQQRLIAIGLDVQRIGSSTAEDGTSVDLDHVRDDLEAVLEEVREVSRGLHPPLLSRLGLRAAILGLARRSSISCRLEIDLDERPAEAIETAVYYVVAEALTNATKYSNATSISVTISTERERLNATFADDGVGGAVAVGGSGLVGLSDRVEALGGRFSLDSPRGEGTRISIALPLNPPR